MADKSSIISRFRAKAEDRMLERGSRESLDWFNHAIRKERKLTGIQSVTEEYRRARMTPGKLVTYKYDPKHADTLPYYDEHPLVLLCDVTRDGWIGLNMHYLNPKLRADVLYEVGYQRLSPVRLVKQFTSHPLTTPCVKKYIAKQVQTTPVEIPVDDWEIVIQLPYEAFVKGDNRKVWKESRTTNKNRNK